MFARRTSKCVHRISANRPRRTGLDNADYLREKLNLPDCQIILRVDREVFDSENTSLSHDTRYFITSLDPSKVSASDLQKLIRDHWQIESATTFCNVLRRTLEGPAHKLPREEQWKEG